ncbi:MAG TPA: hypothetical protein VKB32_05010 [Actinomycetota bacterium]|nr:hypothetical protein [Actinomycetota bacterium]
MNLATTVFASGVAANPTPLGIEPAPITSDTTEPVGPVATATPVTATDAATNDATINHLLCLLTMTFLPFPFEHRWFCLTAFAVAPPGGLIRSE